MLVDVPHQQLASAMGFQEKKAQDLQETLQRVLDRREEERQSKELLQLYLNAVAKEDETSQAGMARTLYVFCFFAVFSTLYPNDGYYFRPFMKKNPAGRSDRCWHWLHICLGDTRWSCWYC